MGTQRPFPSDSGTDGVRAGDDTYGDTREKQKHALLEKFAQGTLGDTGSRINTRQLFDLGLAIGEAITGATHTHQPHHHNPHSHDPHHHEPYATFPSDWTPRTGEGCSGTDGLQVATGDAGREAAINACKVDNQCTGVAYQSEYAGRGTGVMYSTCTVLPDADGHFPVHPMFEYADGTISMWWAYVKPAPFSMELVSITELTQAPTALTQAPTPMPTVRPECVTCGCNDEDRTCDELADELAGTEYVGANPSFTLYGTCTEVEQMYPNVDCTGCVCFRGTDSMITNVLDNNFVAYEASLPMATLDGLEGIASVDLVSRSRVDSAESSGWTTCEPEGYDFCTDRKGDFTYCIKRRPQTTTCGTVNGDNHGGLCGYWCPTTHVCMETFGPSLTGTPNFDVDGNNEWLTDDYETYIRNNEEYYQMSCVLRSTTSAPTGVPTNAPTNAPTAVCNDQLNALCAQRQADGTFVHSGCAEAYRDQCDKWSCAAA